MIPVAFFQFIPILPLSLGTFEVERIEDAPGIHAGA
jgi:hypothetical protein